MNALSAVLPIRPQIWVRFGKKDKPTPISPQAMLAQSPHDILDRFVVVGDDGLNNRVHRQLVRQMEQLHQRSPFTTLLRLGDNVYGPGNDHTNNPLDGNPRLFVWRLVKPFKRLFDKHVRHFLILGNHDVKHGHDEAQLKFLNLPRYYNFRRGNIEFFALDTTVFLPGYDGCYKNDRQKAADLAQKQVAWLEKALKESTAKYKVVMGHYPLYTSGKYFNRGRNAGILRGILEPLLVKNKVDIYLCGHEHHYERSRPIYGIHHFMSGSGSLLTREIAHEKDPPYPRQKLVRDHQFLSFTETPEGLAFETIDRKGRIIDQGLVPAKNHAPG